MTICRAIRTSIQCSSDGADSDIWVDIPNLNGQRQYLSQFLSSLQLTSCSGSRMLRMEWHWELFVTYEFQYQYIRRCSHLDGPLSLSLPDSDWYHLISMQGHRAGERGRTEPLLFNVLSLSYQSLRILRFSLIIYKDKDAWQRCHNGRRIIFKSARIQYLLYWQQVNTLLRFLRFWGSNLLNPRRGGICYPGLYRITPVIGRSRRQAPDSSPALWLASWSYVWLLIGQYWPRLGPSHPNPQKRQQRWN